MNINEEEKRVYIDVSGFISKKEANNFLNSYNQTMKNKKNSLYKLNIIFNYYSKYYKTYLYLKTYFLNIDLLFTLRYLIFFSILMLILEFKPLLIIN